MRPVCPGLYVGACRVQDTKIFLLVRNCVFIQGLLLLIKCTAHVKVVAAPEILFCGASKGQNAFLRG